MAESAFAPEKHGATHGLMLSRLAKGIGLTNGSGCIKSGVFLRANSITDHDDGAHHHAIIETNPERPCQNGRNGP